MMLRAGCVEICILLLSIEPGQTEEMKMYFFEEIFVSDRTDRRTLLSRQYSAAWIYQNTNGRHMTASSQIWFS